jgi:type IV pilus assembly protein PilY1
MPVKSLKLMILCLLAGSLNAAAYAEDIDLFVGAQAAGNNLPNVLFIIDNTANWNQAFTNEMASLANTFAHLPENADGTPKFNIGIMLATETGSPNNNVSGAYVRAAIRPMTAANKAAYAALISSFDQLADKGNGGYSALNMAEAYRYLSSGVPYAGNYKVKADFTGNISGSAASNAIYALRDNALGSQYAGRYNGPGGNGCNNFFIIFVSNGPNQESNSIDAQANGMLSAAGGSTAQIALSPTGSQGNPSDEWARFMRQSVLKVVTYTIDVNPPAGGQGPGWSALLKSMADMSDGKYAAVNSTTGSGEQISDAVGKALSEIQAVNSVFASVSLPLSVNSQGTYLNQVYVGLFRPDADAFPLWGGNLKQYKLGHVGADLKLHDANDDPAINSLTGFITECARSFWTPTATDTYWSFKPRGDCILPSLGTASALKNSNSPDGNIVEKGAQAQVQRSRTTRTLKTCSPVFSSCDAFTDFDTTNLAITPALLGAASSTERNSLIEWAMGKDVADEDLDGVTTDEMRSSIHGDVVHSRPVALNFGTSTTPNIVVFYGGNDGVFRAVNGNRTGNIGSGSAAVAPGQELWGFIPPEFFGNIKRLRDNNVQISFPTVTSPSALPKPYGIDGAISAHVSGSNAWVYAAMRRGGRALYSFNVPTADPAAATLKWKVGCPQNFPASGTVSDVGCTTGFEDMGQTWSSPKPITTSGYGSPLLIMGGGYDPCEDADPNTCTASSKGNKVYVLNAATGTLQRTFTTARPVVADVAVAPDPVTGQALYAYVVDMGGHIYRIDIGNAAPGAWAMTQIASVGCGTAASCTQPRKFMFAPDLAYDSGTYVLLLGSGNRERPRNYTNTVQDYFFMLRDKPEDSTWLTSEMGACGAATLCLDSLTPILTSADPSAEDLANKKGWYLGMRSTEQVVTSAIIILGNVTFSTHEPARPLAGTCSSNLGTARVYNISYLNAAGEQGAPRAHPLPTSIGLPPSPVGGMVTLDDGALVPFCIGCSPDSPLESVEPTMPPGSVPPQPKSRMYWYIQR